MSERPFSLSSSKTTACHEKCVFQKVELKREAVCRKKKTKTVSSRKHVTLEIGLQDMPLAKSIFQMSFQEIELRMLGKQPKVTGLGSEGYEGRKHVCLPLPRCQA